VTTPLSVSAAVLAAGDIENRFSDASALIERYLVEGADVPPVRQPPQRCT
jgi:hypothetical protein